MTGRARRILSALVVLVLAAAMFLGAGLLLGGRNDVAVPGGTGETAASPPLTASREDVEAGVAALQARLERLPGDASAWAALGGAYVAQARLTADPGYYGKAEGAFARSLEVRPKDNAEALTGQASLAAARHDFSAALRLGREAKRINPFSATNQGVLVDALVELGRYGEADAELQRMVDVRPGVPSFTRVSYVRELAGNMRGARVALEQAARFAYQPSDRAYVAYYLGELAFNSGDLTAAARHFREGLARQPGSAQLQAGRAKVAAARGDTQAALADYAAVVTRLPQPSYLLEYADLLASLGRTEEAERQYALVDATQRLFQAEGANVDLELALYDADRGRAAAALAVAKREWDRRRSVHVEDAYGWALHAAGRDREALVHARAAEARSTRNALFAYHRGMIEKSLGMRAQARASLTRALRVNPHFSVRHAPLAKRALAELGTGT